MADKDLQIIASTPKGIVVGPVTAAERLIIFKEVKNEKVNITEDNINVLKIALRQLSAQALNFANMYINDASVRYNYCYKINKMSEEILRDVEAGKATAQEGAEFANQMRNQIMEEARIQSSTIGKAIAQKKKVTGRTIEELIKTKLTKHFQERHSSNLLQMKNRPYIKASLILLAGQIQNLQQKFLSGNY